MNQQAKVYAWERKQDWWTEASYSGKEVYRSDGTMRDFPAMSQTECRRLVRRYLKLYRVSTNVNVRFNGRRRWARGWATGITLPNWAMTPSVVLHETAHCICAQRGLHVAHGPVFVRMYIELIASYFRLPKGDILNSARAYGLKVAAWSELKPRLPL